MIHVRSTVPEHGRDGDEPEGSVPLPAGDEDWDEGEGAQQGLYVTLPAEELTLAGFAGDGRADTMAPGPLLAAILSAVAGEDGKGLAGLSDDQLIGFLSGARRMESLAAWAQMAALAEFAGRHPAAGDPAGVSEFAADEVACAFRLTWQAAAGQVGYARDVAARLPATFAALAAGKIHPVHVRIIEDETSILSAAGAAAADEKLAEAAQSKTFGELRSAAHRLVIKLDPGAVLNPDGTAAAHGCAAGPRPWAPRARPRCRAWATPAPQTPRAHGHAEDPTQQGHPRSL